MATDGQNWVQQVAVKILYLLQYLFPQEHPVFSLVMMVSQYFLGCFVAICISHFQAESAWVIHYPQLE